MEYKVNDTKLIETKKKGEISMEEVRKALDRKYKMKEQRNERSLFISGFRGAEESGRHS